MPGRHLALDATAALALVFSLLRDESGGAPSASELSIASTALASFTGSKRRSEIVGESGGVLFMDDYGHHPTAIRETIRGIKEFWPDRRLVVDFMSHTYSRTRALFDEFASCLNEADVVVMHGIYASAREKPDPEITGRRLFEEAKRRSPPNRSFFYYEGVLEGEEALASELKSGDLFLTMGAGDNWKLGAALLKRLAAKKENR